MTEDAFFALKNSIENYSALSTETWSALIKICRFRMIEKNRILYGAGEIPSSFSYVYSGLFRNYIIDEKGSEYNKIFFDEGSFPGSMTALLKSEPSRFTIEALEPSSIIEIDFKAYRRLLIDKHDLKLFHIYYLEENWLLKKEIREIEIVQNDGTMRYLKFLEDYPGLVDRLPQYHIASHLGITPTQLSRIRKNLSINICK